MIRNYFIVSAIILAVFIVPVSAQDENPVSVGVKAGWFINSFEPMSDLVENNWSVGADLRFQFNENWGISGEVQYSTKDDTGYDFQSTLVDFEYTAIPIHLDGIYRLQMGSSDSDGEVYFGAGLSLVMADLMVNDGASMLEMDEAVIGWNAKVGYQFDMFFVEAQYMCAEWEDEEITTWFDVEDYVNLGGFSGWVGVRF